MSRINSNVSSLLAQRVLTQNQTGLTKTLERLSTGLRINRGSDDPAGLIVSEKLRAQQRGLSTAIANAERAEQVVNIAEGGLQEISNLLLEVQSLVGQSANEGATSTEEREANQLQIDSILQTIDRIAESTSFQDSKLLNGNFDFTISGKSAAIKDFSINAAKLNTGDTRAVQVTVFQSAQHGGLYMSTNGTSLDLSAADATFTFEVGGSKGVREFTFTSGETTARIATAINAFKDVTGVSAVASGTGLFYKSTEFGSDEFVSIEVSDDAGQTGGIALMSTNAENTISTGNYTAFTALTDEIRDEGQDLGASVAGITGAGDGKTISIATDFLDVSLELSTTNAQTLGSLTAFTVTGGGADFSLGAEVNIGSKVSLGIQNVASRTLGSFTDGYLDSLGAGKANNVVDGNFSDAQKVVSAAIDKISSLRGRLGAFQSNTINATIRSLGVTLENTTAAESVIRDTDFASATAELTRNQILVNAAQSSLAIANANPQSALALLG